MPRDTDEPDGRPRRRYDRDDENLPTARKSGVSPIVIVLIVAGGLFLVGVLACGGVMYLGYRRAAAERAETEAMLREADAAAQAREQEAAREAASDKAVATRHAEAFVNTLRQNRLDDAYQQTGQDYRANTSGQQFAELLRPVVEALAHPNHRNPFVEPADRWGPTTGDRFVFKLVWTAGYDVAITCVKTPAGWRVDQLAVRKE